MNARTWPFRLQAVGTAASVLGISAIPVVLEAWILN